MEIEDIRLIAIQTALDMAESAREYGVCAAPADILRWSKRIVQFVVTETFDTASPEAE